VIIGDQAMVLNYFGIDWKIAFVDSVISNVLLFAISLLVMTMLRFYLPRGNQYINIFFLCLFLSLLWLLLSKWILHLVIDDAAHTELLHHSNSIRFSIAFLLLGCVTMISVLWYNQQEQKELESRKADAARLARDAELFKLRQQLQPHFLFNSLNSINALIGSRPAEARKMVQQLSDFLRGTLKKEETQTVTLGEELQYLQLYLDIEKVRFGNRLNTVLQVDEQVQGYLMPALILQPIMENAIKFGLYDTTGSTTIRLEAGAVEQDLLIRIHNPFDPETSSPKRGTGFGLKSVERRLFLLFGRNDLLKTGVEKENTFVTEVRIPQGPASSIT
jgi:LytS/YehU family sensor histidine kinase